MDRRSSLLIRKASCLNSPMFELQLNERFKILRKLGTGRFATLFSAEDCRCPTSTRITLRVFSKNTCKLADFLREYNASYFLSAHPNIVDTYEGENISSTFIKMNILKNSCIISIL